MVDSIGAKPSVAGDRSVARIAAATQTTAVQTPVQSSAKTGASALPESIGLAQSMAAAPPINAARVAEIKKAIASNSFPILPATIADRLMALSLAWNSNDTA